MSVTLLLTTLFGHGFAEPNAPLDRPFTSRNLRPALLEERYHGMLAGGRQSFLFPVPCDSASGDPACGFRYRLAYRDSARGERLGILPLLGGEFRGGEASTSAFEAGAISSGSLGPASFLVDARLFAENSGEGADDYDREGRDRQDEATTGSVSYDSYARFRANFNLDVAFGRFTVARDAVHWGPGLLNNLVFHQDAVPFNHLLYTATLGPVRVASLYGDLVVAEGSLDTLALRDRRIYAHRYECSLGRNLVLGVSEQIILYDEDIPFLFTPVFPLFIAKGFMYEHANNGNLAVDFSWRVIRGMRLYGEFLLDDMESPASLFVKDYAQNKWALMAGTHAGFERGEMRAGAVAEYSRIEPWVYAHFRPFTAQTANFGHPLGNQQGPNSQSAILRTYLRHAAGWYLSLQGALYWKGSDPGSDLNDDAPDEPFTPKAFLGNADAEGRLSSTAALEWKNLGAFLSAEVGNDVRVVAGLRGGY